MKAKFLISLGALLAVAATTNVIVKHFELPAAKVTVRVLDENQQPVGNANVWLSFKDRITFKDLNVRGMTDASGLFTGEGGCDASGIGCSITKEGYYDGWPPIPKFYNIDTNNNRWQPWNETYTTVLRPIGKLVALYAKKVETQIPAFDQPCGYDLEVGDWASPYGKGLTKDLIFTLHQEWRGNYDYDVQGELTFKNPLDGLQEASIPDVGKNSVFKWERQAPESGYDPKQQLRNAWFPEGSGKKFVRSFKSQDVWQGYYFRTRTVEQDGKIVSAHYGKIRGGIAVYPHDPKTKITFTYYYNPTSLDRNLEWDAKRSLFGGLNWEETPREP